jgi:twitching motility protein PilT
MPDGSSVDVQSILHAAIDREASDVHLVAGYPPVLRVHGELEPAGAPPLTDADTQAVVAATAPPPVRARIAETHNADFSFALQHAGETRRFRVNVFRTRESLGVCFRLIPGTIPSLEWAGIPQDLAARIFALRNGLVLVTGITGSGKSTTLAIIVDHLNRNDGRRIITVEEPIEYVFSREGRSVVTQREVGVDVATFYDGLKFGLRQDPDVILVGEIRDQVTAQMALSAAETGHLVLATLHTRDAKGAISRYADLFPRDAQDDVRSQLSLSLRYVISQHLIPAALEGEKRVLAVEVLTNNHAVASAIRLGKIESIDNAIQTGRRDGMMTLDDSLARLARAGQITRAIARRYANDPERIA